MIRINLLLLCFLFLITSCGHAVIAEKTEPMPVITSVIEIVSETEAVEPADPKFVYLTFDDGPNYTGTDKVLEILDSYGIKATFFLIGEFASYYPSKVRAMYAAGHVIGSHSYSHVYKDIYKSADSLMEDLKKWEETIEKILGENLPYKLYRFPGGTKSGYLNRTLRPLIVEAVKNYGYTVFDWTMDTNDSISVDLAEGQTIEDYIRESVISDLAYTEKYKTLPKIVLMHDVKDHTANALGWIIEYLRDNGYSFGTLDQLENGWNYQ
ncbi:MAG: polysaccharide deacetylase [Oscillospiraceae bacterium]|nr:polysaccharide deacetylase [Oscillospiraceae bacterium]